MVGWETIMKRIEGYEVKTLDKIKGMRSGLPKGSPNNNDTRGDLDQCIVLFKRFGCGRPTQ